MPGLVQDLRYAVRRLHKSPGFTFFVIAVMALGIGATTALFSVIRAILLEPLPYRDPDRVVLLSKSVTPIRFDEMKIASQSFDELGASAGIEHLAISGIGEPEVLNGERVSANFLQILGICPLQGRSFRADDDKPGAPAVVMVSAELWWRRFGGDPRIAGRVVTLAGSSYTIIGVLPAAFQFPFSKIDVLITKPSELSTIDPPSRPISPILKIFGRLKPHVNLQQANAEMAVLRQQYALAHPGMLDAKADTPERLQPLKDELVSEIRPKLWLLFGSVGLVLVIVCANIGSLLLARATFRSREFAVRAAIGAGRGRIVRQLLAESVSLACVGGGLGAALAASSLSAIRGMTFINLPRSGEIRMDGMVLGFAAAISLVTGTLFGLIPSLAASRPDLAIVLRGSGEAGFTAKTAIPRLSRRGLLVVGQMAVSIVLLIGATLLIESLARLYRVDPGFEPANLLTMHVPLSPERYRSEDKKAAFYEQLVKRVETLPGVQDAALSSMLPMTGWMGVPVQAESDPIMRLNERPIAALQFVSPEYFRTMKIALRRGREFTEHDDLDAVSVAIINESMARRFWPQYPNGADPIGQHILMGSKRVPKEIVAIVADVRQKGKDQDPMLGLYLPGAQMQSSYAVLAVRTGGDPLLLANAVRKQIFAIDSDQPVSDVMTMNDIVEASEGQLRLMMRLLAAFAGAAALLAVVGLYGVISYSVSQRTREIGIRRALGAGQSSVLALVIGQGFGLSAIGIALGICAAFGLTRVLRDLLFQVSATDPVIFADVSILFAAVALLACYIPARRAAKVDPMVALRYE